MNKIITIPQLLQQRETHLLDELLKQREILRTIENDALNQHISPLDPDRVSILTGLCLELQQKMIDYLESRI